MRKNDNYQFDDFLNKKKIDEIIIVQGLIIIYFNK